MKIFLLSYTDTGGFYINLYFDCASEMVHNKKSETTRLVLC